MSCRFPGGVTSPEDLWELVRDGRDAITPFPENRGWDLEGLFDTDPDRSGTSYVNEGGFLHDADQFDAEFFEISPREALAMDPQQRLVLELSWEVLERAGIDPGRLKGSKTGTFMGFNLVDHGSTLPKVPDELEGHFSTGSSASVLSGRIAYTLGLEGPAVSVDTACSSSLVALHLAVQALRNGDCSLALVGGVTIMSSPGEFVTFSRQRGLARDGRSKAFSAGADGLAMSEGVGMLLVERLSDARRRGHRVLAVVRGSATNQDGASNGLTAPNGPSQQRVIRQALASARLSAGDVDVVEAHGTGTSLGDPIEAQALLATYGQERGEGRGPLWLGSVKSNIGHAQAAAGVAGVIKMVMAMRHGRLPRTLHVDEPSEHIDWSSGAVELLSESVAWEVEGGPRRAGVSSFGISGTNAHVILEEAPLEESVESGDGAVVGSGGVVPLVVSGRSVGGLVAQAGRLGEWLGSGGGVGVSLVGVGRSLALGRAGLEHRAVVLAGDRGGAVAGLGAVAAGEPAAGVVSGVVVPGRVVMVFPGQGSQWVGMGRELLSSSEVFAGVVAECEEALAPLVEWSLTHVLREGDEEFLGRVDVIQPVLFAVMVGLARLWESVGVVPDVVVGHSQGEIAAAHIAGGLSLKDAVRVVALRSQALVSLAGGGAMAQVALGEEAASELVSAWEGRVGVAAVNGPASTVVSGEVGAVEEVLARCEEEGVWARRIEVDYASHSPQVEEIGPGLEEALAGIRPVSSSSVAFFSTVSGDVVDTATLDAGYWVRNLRRPVRFAPAVEELARSGAGVFIEVSPHPVLTGGVADTLSENGAEVAAVVETLRRDRGGWTQFLTSAAQAHAFGVELDWDALFPTNGTHRHVDLPTYAFQHQRYWLEPAPGHVAGDVRGLGQRSADHPLLGSAVGIAASDEWLMTGRLSLTTHPWLADHTVRGTTLAPGAALLEILIRAGDEVGCSLVEEVTTQAPLVLSGKDGVQLQVRVGPAGDGGRREATIHARDDDGDGERPWTCHATGVLLPSEATTTVWSAEEWDATAWPPKDARPVGLDDFYERLSEADYQYGPVFRGLRAAWRGADGAYLAEVALPESEHEDATRFGIHPALLDATLHVGAFDDVERGSREVWLPFSYRGVRLLASGATTLRVRVTGSVRDGMRIQTADSTGRPVAVVGSLDSRRIDDGGLKATQEQAVDDSLLALRWTELPLGEYAGRPHRSWALLGDEDEPATAALLAAIAEQPGTEAAVFADLDALGRFLGQDAAVTPDAVVWCLPAPAVGATAEDVHIRVGAVLTRVQAWLDDPRLSASRLVVVSHGAVATSPGQDVSDLAQAAALGLLRAAQAENPDRITLVDLEPDESAYALLPGTVAAAVDGGEPQAAVRAETALVPRLGHADTRMVPERDVRAWRLDNVGDRGSFDDLALVHAPRSERPLDEGLIRVAVRAAGINFHDVFIALGLYPGEAMLDGMGGDIAGVVTEVGPGVETLAVGDHVMGLGEGGFARQAVTHHKMVVKIPEGWTFERAASLTTVFVATYYGLRDVVGLRPGQSVLVHAAAGGMGMAATQIAQHLGATVFATASPAKWETVQRNGVPLERVSSSRDLDFEQKFMDATGGAGVDVVLNCLTGDFVDASLRMLPRGGHFLEMGKADMREPEVVGRDHPGVTYRLFDLFDAGLARIGEILAELVDLIARGAITPPPVRVWDVRQAGEAFDFMKQARHTGKIVLRIPPEVEPSGTVVVTGGTGTLGALVARHLVTAHGVGSLVLASRQGPEAPGAAELRQELEGLGVRVRVLACDVADRDQVVRLLGEVPEEHPLTGVVHTAGVLDDGLIGDLTPQRVSEVLRAKADGAWHLHDLTRHLPLGMFAMFSSAAGVLGGPGQGNYAAANAFLDALAQHRRALGLAGTSLAWGLWERTSGLTGKLDEHDRVRVGRAGMVPMPAEYALELFDTACLTHDPFLAPMRVDPGALRSQADAGTLLPPLRGLVRNPARRAVGAEGRSEGASFARTLAPLSEEKRQETVLNLLRTHIVAVLGHSSPGLIDAKRAFQDLGFDSLTAVELRNRLNAATGLRLPATLIFDYPTPEALAGFVCSEAMGDQEVVLGATSTAVSDDPIVIVGMACRYPGGSDSPEKLWQLVAEGRDAVGEFPLNRGWDVEGTYDPDPEVGGKIYTREGGFLYEAGEFDAAMFGISPREALAMDPQQRLLLETAWESMERAHIVPADLKGSRTGVFVGASSPGYGVGTEVIGGFQMTGTTSAVISGRLAYTFGLEGPALTVDTACSSSLVALHLAVQALRNDECSLALVGGALVMGSIEGFVEFCWQRALAPDGRCKAFSAAGDGFGVGEGAGVLLVERLSDAVRNGHEVLAVVRGTAVNQDGASNGLAAPNGPAQRKVIRQALANARLSPGEVDAVEAHGTGTSLGDPIEAHALLATYGQGREEGRPLRLGSIKSNIGHVGTGAGIASVIKMVMAMRHGVLPKTLHVEEPSPRIDWSSGAVELLTEPVAWDRDDHPRRAGVSGFGISGTNAHVILEEAPEQNPRREPAAPDRPALAADVVPLVLSARSADALAGQAGRLREFLNGEAGTAAALADVGRSLAATRAGLEHRAVVLAADHEQATAGLAALAAGRGAPGVVSGAPSPGRVVMVFPGQGSQWFGMARELLARSEVFAQTLAACDKELVLFADWSLTHVLREGDEEFLGRVDVIQPVLFAVMVGLARLWESVGVVPDVVVGHSQGEIAAAHIAGGLSLKDAVRVVALRSQALVSLAGGGAMAQVALGEEAASELVSAWEGRVGVAAVNGPASTVVSGEVGAVEEVLARCEEEGVWARRIEVDYASHSPQVEEIGAGLEEALAGVRPVSSSSVAFFSTVSGDVVDTATLDAGYWVRNLRRPVRFAPAVEELARSGAGVFIEASPHPVLTGGITDTLQASGTDAPAGCPAVVETLRRDHGGLRQFLTSAAQAHTHGVGLDWDAVLPAADAAGGTRRHVDLPTYAFQHQWYWLRPLEETPDEAGTGPADSAFWEAVEGGDVDSLAAALDVRDARVHSSLGEVVPALSSWWRQRRELSVLDSWRYRITWTPVPSRTTTAPTGTWLVVSPEHDDADGGLGASCAHALTEAGATVAHLRTDPAASREELRTALRDTCPDHVAGVVSLLGLDERHHPGGGGLSSGVHGTVTLLQALTEAEVAGPLWCLTRGAVEVPGADEDAPTPEQAQVWALGRVAALEHFRLWGGVIDLPSGPDERSWRQVAALLADREHGEDQIAVRAQGALGRRMRRAPLDGTPARRWQPTGTVLITGGTGAIGGHLARWAAESGAPHVLLLSRSGVDAPGADDLRAELTATGTRVTVAACDITDAAACAAAIEDATVDQPPVRTVIHAAGAIRPAFLTDLTTEDLHANAHAKVVGARVLDELFGEDADLDAFVLFSSNAAVWGNAGHGAYAAANAHLDALARARRARGLTATSVAWGAWDAGGMLDAHDSEENLRRRGVLAMPSALALAALRTALDHDETTVAVADIDWERFAPSFTSVRPSPLLAELPEVRRIAEASEASQPQDATSTAAFAQRLEGLTEGARNRLLLDLVRSHAAEVLGHRSADEVAADRAFRDLGFDSLTAVQLRNALTAATGLRLPATLVFDYPTPQALVRHLATEILQSPPQGESASVSAAEGPGATADEPIAIVGMACHYPGGVRSPEDLWRLVAEGTDAVGGFPTDRGWDLAALYDPDPERAGTSNVRQGGFLRDVADFDADFFGISPREALAMDPQQRLMLETSWEALERAGIAPPSLAGTATGVYVGALTADYFSRLDRLPEELEGYMGTGMAGSVVSGRVAYSLGLEGPAVTVDTACSSSLVALHMAAQGLRNGECSLALAGGVTVMSSPAGFVEFSRQGVLSVDGRCKAFSAAADGFGASEGVGVLVLERLSDAVRHGHQVLALVPGSAVNQDGASNGLSAPNGPSQQRVIRKALAGARLAPQEVDAVEAHGTGTSLGDPIEAQALLATYGQGRGHGSPLWLGSIKSNIGHAAAAAGVAGVIKMVMAMRHGLLPRTLHAEEPSAHIDWSSGSVELLNEPVEWKADGRPRRAGVSSFGISGTNAHVILEQAPLQQPQHEEQGPEPADEQGQDRAAERARTAFGAVPLPISARSAEALAGQAERLRQFLLAGSPEQTPLADLGWSLATTRAELEHRGVVLARSHDEALGGLADLARGERSDRAVAGPGPAPGDRRVVMVFPGQGSQWAGMAKELLDTSAVFTRAIEDCEDALAPHVDWSLTQVLRDGDEEKLARVDVVQPVLFAVMVALARLWESVGVRPDAVVGHSQGEIAAAHVAGALSLEDAARVVALRSLALVELAGEGAMASLALGREETRALVDSADAELSVAAVNGPASTVVSGAPAAVHDLLGRLAADGVWARAVPVDYASHSPHVERLRDRLRADLAPIKPVTGELAFFSTVTGTEIDTAGLDADYWYRNLRNTVEFSPVVEALADQGFGAFVEASAHPVLTAAIEDTVPASCAVVGTLRRDDGGPDRFLSSVAEAHTGGVAVAWEEVLTAPGRRRVDLPTYAFQRRRYWLEAPATPDTATDPESARFWQAVEDGDLDSLAATLELNGDGETHTSLQALVPALAAWRRRRRERTALDSWRYRVAWEPLRADAGPAAPVLPGVWLLVAPEDGTAGDLVEQAARVLAEAGADVVPLRTPQGPARGALADAVDGALAAHGHGTADLAGALSLLGLDGRAHPEAPAVTRGLADTTALFQALLDVGTEAPMWAITRAAVGVDDTDAAPDAAQAGIWGLGRVAALEHPRLWGGLIDLPPVEHDTEAIALLPTALTAAGEDQMALRDGGVLTRRMTRAPLAPAGAARPWQPRGTTLVTDGTGALGSRAARWLAEQGAEHLALVSAEGPEARGSAELVRELTARGAECTVHACDITDSRALADLTGLLRSRGRKIRNVVHTATDVELSPVSEAVPEHLGLNARLKVAGARALDREFDGADGGELDAFVLFSSVAALWGSAEHAAFAAANAQVEAVAEARRRRGQSATAIAWGMWDVAPDDGGDEDGQAPQLAEALARQGLPLLDPDQALPAVRDAVEHGETVIAIADIDWRRFVPVFTAARTSTLVDGVPEARTAAEADAAQAQEAELAARTALVERLTGMTAGEADQLLRELVCGNVAAVLGHGSAGAVNPERAFSDVGFTSLTSVELRNRLNAATGLRLPATLVFDHPTPAVLADHLMQELVPREDTELSILGELDRLQSSLARVSRTDSRDAITQRLEAILATWRHEGLAGDGADVATTMRTATAEEVIDFIDSELGL
ncbi:SDR family NAD(P)-dependent oxidoreductase [Streptomyces sp. WMMC1477]|nr:type I polyketide synthase [Streptomyces sp. WMMC1477]MCZ7434199.1 SDR family NAD(P)-dependent oxidoreductase [Streptomyces sp. WMMC1477]